MHQRVCRHIRNCCYSIKVFLDDELISEGTAFSFLASGELLTAGHVITGRFPIRQADVRDSRVSIYGQAPGSLLGQYSIEFCGIAIEAAEFTHPLQVDIGVLRPKVKPSSPAPFLSTLVSRSPEVGEQVLIAGFSEEVELPFRVDRAIDRSLRGTQEFFRAMRLGYEAQMGNLMIKSAMIGNVRSFEASSSQTHESVNGDVFYMDNSLHFGASGGPVVTTSGEAIGIVSERAVTDASTGGQVQKVPSGSTVAISARTLLSLNTMTAR
jgi:hypothetical protein